MHHRAISPHHVTLEEFFLAEDLARDGKHEWMNGTVYAMSGASIEHARLTANVSALLKNALTGCTVYSSDLMIGIRSVNLYTYPDVSVVCGAIETGSMIIHGKTVGHAIFNPTLLVEVLSPSSEAYDRGEKFGYYTTVPSLRAYVLVAQDEPRIEIYTRPDPSAHWTHVTGRQGDTLALHDDKRLVVDDIYR